MMILKHIIITTIVAIMLTHIATPHNHYTKLDALHSLEHNEVDNFVDVLGLAFHHGNDKDLSESNQVSYLNDDFSDYEIIAYSILISENVQNEESYIPKVYPYIFIKYQKYFCLNYSPLRAPPKDII